METPSSRYFIISNPNSSNPMIIDAIGEFVTPQNIEIMATAAHIDGDNPKTVPNKQPNAAPMVKEGTISPPLNPAPSVSAVKTIFQKNASGAHYPAMASLMIFTPAPLYTLVRRMAVSAITRTPATAIRR